MEDITKKNLEMGETDDEASDFLMSTLPLAAPVVSLCAYLMASYLPFVLPYGRKITLGLLAVLLAGINAFAARHLTGSRRFALAPALLAVNALAFLTLLGSPLGRYLLIGAVTILLSVFYWFLDRHFVRRHDFAESTSDYERLVSILHAPASFFLLAFMFALAEVGTAPSWLMAIVAGGLASFLTHEFTWNHRKEGASFKTLTVAVGVIGAELFLVMSLLPVRHIVSAAVVAIMLALVLHRLQDSLTPERDDVSFRRQAIFSILFIILILATAQWL